ncbi:hypothetical protein SNEBB_007925 [Seison nebaliae]|nr:hypothetical protein SNEBB_007925 [Seison nebaliae]
MADDERKRLMQSLLASKKGFDKSPIFTKKSPERTVPKTEIPKIISVDSPKQNINDFGTRIKDFDDFNRHQFSPKNFNLTDLKNERHYPSNLLSTSPRKSLLKDTSGNDFLNELANQDRKRHVRFPDNLNDQFTNRDSPLRQNNDSLTNKYQSDFSPKSPRKYAQLSNDLSRPSHYDEKSSKDYSLPKNFSDLSKNFSNLSKKTSPKDNFNIDDYLKKRMKENLQTSPKSLKKLPKKNKKKKSKKPDSPLENKKVLRHIRKGRKGIYLSKENWFRLELPEWQNICEIKNIDTHIENMKKAYDNYEPVNLKRTPNKWRDEHSITNLKLTLADLLKKGQITLSIENSEKLQHLTFQKNSISEHEHRLHELSELYQEKLRTMFLETRKMFGEVNISEKIVIGAETSSKLWNDEDLKLFQNQLINFFSEQFLSKRSNLLNFIHIREVLEKCWSENTNNLTEMKCLENFVYKMKLNNRSNILKFFDEVALIQGIGHLTILLIITSLPVEDLIIIFDYYRQKTIHMNCHLYVVAFNTKNLDLDLTLKLFTEREGGTFHAYSPQDENWTSIGTEFEMIVEEMGLIKRTLNYIEAMYRNSLECFNIEIVQDLNKRYSFVKELEGKPLNHERELDFSYHCKCSKLTSREWLNKYGLKALQIDLYQILGKNSHKTKTKYVQVLDKVIESTINKQTMHEITWPDGSVRYVHIDMKDMFHYKRSAETAITMFEHRLQWLQSGSCQTFGSLLEEVVLVVVDLRGKNTKYTYNIQNALRLLLEEQMNNKKYFNIILCKQNFETYSKMFVKTSEEQLNLAWLWILENGYCSGTCNLTKTVKQVLEQLDETSNENLTYGIYYLTLNDMENDYRILRNYLCSFQIIKRWKLHICHGIMNDHSNQSPSHHLQDLAHSTDGRYLLFYEIGKVSGDDIQLIEAEIGKTVEQIGKCQQLIDKVKEKRHIKQMTELAKMSEELQNEEKEKSENKNLTRRTNKLTTDRINYLNGRRTNSSNQPWKPSSASTDLVPKIRNGSTKKKPPTKNGKNRYECFYLDTKTIGTTLVQRGKKQRGKIEEKKKKSTTTTPTGELDICRSMSLPVPDGDEWINNKNWLKKYSLFKLKLEFDNIVKSTNCPHTPSADGEPSKYCNTFPTAVIHGKRQHIHSRINELHNYESVLQQLVVRYVKRLQWSLVGSKLHFGPIETPNLLIVLDLSKHMTDSIEMTRIMIYNLIWEQVNPNFISFNIIGFSDEQISFVDSNSFCECSEEACEQVIEWLYSITPTGHSGTYEMLQELLTKHNIYDKQTTIFFVTNNVKPDSVEFILEQLEKNKIKLVNENVDYSLPVINTLSLNCDDELLISFLRNVSRLTCGSLYLNLNEEKLQNIRRFCNEAITEPDISEIAPISFALGDNIFKMYREICKCLRFESDTANLKEVVDEFGMKDQDPFITFNNNQHL